MHSQGKSPHQVKYYEEIASLRSDAELSRQRIGNRLKSYLALSALLRDLVL